MFEIETDASDSAAIIPTTTPKSEIPTKIESNKPSTNKSTSQDDHHRHPSIKFLGKRSKDKVIPKIVTPSIQQPCKTASTTKPCVKKQGNGVDIFSLNDGAWFGRPRLTAAEIEAIESGGATLKL